MHMDELRFKTKVNESEIQLFSTTFHRYWFLTSYSEI